MSGKFSSGQTVAYDYYATLAGGVCIGPADELVSIILNGQEVWPKGTPWAVGITCAPGTLYVFDAQTWTCTTSHVASATNAPGSGLEGWTEYTYTPTGNADNFTITDSTGLSYGTLTLYWGASGQTVDSLLTSANNDGGVNGNLGNGDQHPAYTGLCYVVLRDFLLGEEVQSGPNLEIVIRRKPNQTVVTGGAAGLTDGQANLAAVAAELLTDENCLGLPSAMLDATSFNNVATYLQTNAAQYGASVLVDASESVSSLFDKVIQMMDGYLRWNPSTQLIELGVYQHGVVPGSGGSLFPTFITLTQDDLTDKPQFTAKSWQQTISRATVRYNPRQLDYQQTSLQVDDPRAFFVLGTVREQALDRPWIARDQQAMTHGQETLRVMGHAQMNGTLKVRREIGRGIRAGDFVLVDVDLEPNTFTVEQYFRVTKVTIPPTGPITLEVFADNTLMPVPYTATTQPGLAFEPAVPPITSYRFLEVPQALSGGTGGEIVCLAQRPNNLIVGASLYFDTDPTGTFSSLLGQVANFAAKATLNANVAVTDTTIHLNVDTTQVDADYFTQQYSATQQADDTALLLLVQVNAGSQASGGATYNSGTTYALNSVVTESGVQYVSLQNSNTGHDPATSPTWWSPDSGQVAEDGNGYQLLEICSVGTQTLISAGQYDLAVLRARMNTAAKAFATGSTEVWLIPQSLLSYFFSSNFATIRSNRLAGQTPAYAQFRLAPYTFVNSLPLSSANSDQFRFPLQSLSAPTLAWTPPSPTTFTSPTYPVAVPISGTWSDPSRTLNRIKILLRNAAETFDRVVIDWPFTGCPSKAFSETVYLDAAGSYTLKVIGYDSLGLSTEVDVALSATGSGAKCALPEALDGNGNPLLSYPGVALSAYSPSFPLSFFSGTAQKTSNIVGVPSGPLMFTCTTPGATIYFASFQLLSAGVPTRDPSGNILGGQTVPGTVQTYGPNMLPLVCLTDQGSGSVVDTLVIVAQARATGYANSNAIYFFLKMLN